MRIRRLGTLLLNLGIIFGMVIATPLTSLEVSAGPLDAAREDSPTGEIYDPIEVDYGIHERDIIEIKFKEGQRIRLRDGEPTDLDGVGLTSIEAVSAFDAVADGVWTRTHSISEDALDRLRQRAEENSGRPMPDLNLYFRLKLPDGMEAAEAIKLFNQVDEVALALPVPKPAPLPVPPDYQDPGASGDPYQGYLDAAPDGVDARYAWGGSGGTGATIGICDVERGLNFDHADLPDITLVTDPPGAGVTQASVDHGTAVMGEMGGLNNGWGVTGIAYGADLYFGAAWTDAGGYNVAATITACADALEAGDVILIEQQIAGPNRPNNPPQGDQTGLVPVEWYEPSYAAIETAVAAGIVVVEAAGNGAEDLDDPVYSTGNGGHHPFLLENDSGAIIVGAGAPPDWQGTDQRAPLDFSNFGATVDVQGWGRGIVTTGYGDLYDDEGENLHYRESFGGTSGASPIVAASAAIVQSIYQLKNGSAATPAQTKSILQDTGTPQQGEDNIGPLPDLKAAIEEIWDVTLPDPPILSPASGTYAMPLQVTIDYAPGQNGSNTAIRYTLNGSEPTEDSFIFEPDWGDTIYLNYGATVKARAFQFNPTAGRRFVSDSASATYASSTPKVATPLISPGGGYYNQPHQVTISTATPGATIRYRTDGRNPSFFYPGTEYTGPITLDPGTYDIRARGYKDGYYKSDVAESGDIVVNPTVLPAPTIYPSGGDYIGEVTVYIGSTVLGAEIRYTLDNSTPSASSPVFLDPLVLTETTTVKARIYLDGYTESAVNTAVLTVVEGVDTPTITPNGGTGTGSIEVTLSTSTPGATIRYTDNGAEPASFSNLYTGPFLLGVGQHTVKAKAFLDGLPESATASADFTVYESPGGTVADPTMRPFSTQYFVEPFTITMRTDTEGASIYYTIQDGSLPPDPTESDSLYSGPFVVSTNGDYYYKMRAFKTGMSPSNIVQSGQLSLGSAVGTTNVPTISPPGGVFTNAVQVTLLSNDGFETFFYTTNGSDPVSVPPATPPSSQYNTPFNLFGSATVKAKAYRPFFASGGTATASFYFVCATPTISPTQGTFAGAVTVTMETGTTSGANIYYTLDGSEPTEASTPYDGPFALSPGQYTVKAACFRTNYDPSETALSVIVVNEDPVAPSIVSQPLGQTVDVGQAVTFTAEVTGIPTPALQWQRDAIPLAGAVETELVIPAARLSDGGDYRLIARNSAGVATSTVALLAVNPITTHLSIAKAAHADTVEAGQRITYTLTLTNSGLVSSTAQVVDTLSPAAAASSVSAEGGVCGPVTDGSVTCTIGLTTTAPSTIILYVDTNGAFSGTLSNSAVITGSGDFVNVNPANSAGPVQVAVVQVTEDTTPPQVETTSPADGATDVSRNAPVVVDFDESMETGSVVYLISPTLALTPTWSNVDSRLTLAHAEFAATTRYTVSVTAGSDLAGNPLADAPYTWVFTTSAVSAPEADVALSKERIGTGDVFAGDAITYSFTIANHGPTSPVTVTLLDTFNSAAALTGVSGDNCAWTSGSDDVTCTVTDVVTSTPSHLTLVVTTNELYTGVLTNSASISLDGSVVDPNPDNDGAEVAVTVVEGSHGDGYEVFLPLVIRNDG